MLRIHYLQPKVRKERSNTKRNAPEKKKGTSRHRWEDGSEGYKHQLKRQIEKLETGNNDDDDDDEGIYRLPSVLLYIGGKDLVMQKDNEGKSNSFACRNQKESVFKQNH